MKYVEVIVLSNLFEKLISNNYWSLTVWSSSTFTAYGLMMEITELTTAQNKREEQMKKRLHDEKILPFWFTTENIEKYSI